MRNFGIGFGDQLVSGLGNRIGLGMEVKLAGRGWRKVMFLAPFLSGFVALIVRLVWLMVILGDNYRALSEENRIRQVPIKAVRGVILDRNGRVLASNRPVYKVRSGETKDSYKVVSRGEALKLIAEGRDVNLVEDSGREYWYGEVMAHVLGYLGEVSPGEITNRNFNAGDTVGRSGVEEYYDGKLRGFDGARLLEVDTSGLTLREIGKNEPKTGDELKLNIDANLQKRAYELLNGRRGAVVVGNPETGEILALVSSPSFDSGVFVHPGSSEDAAEVLHSENMPLFNRAISGLYPPGSTFKIVSGIAGLESGSISSGFTVIDNGFIEVGGRRYSNWYFTQYGGREGEVGIVRAVARSNDVFFYKLGELTGAKNMADWSRKLGLGSLTGIDLPGEVVGLVPDPVWKERVKKERWFLGDSLIMAIGQGNLLTTPVQMNVVTGIVVSGGKKCSPRVVSNGTDRVSPCQVVEVRGENLELIKRGMYMACARGGTAVAFFGWNDLAASGKLPRVGCKTGTAEFGDSQGKTHAWLVAFVEANEARKFGREPITVTALVEAGGEGSKVAAPIVRKVMAEYFGVGDKYRFGDGGGGE